MPTDANQATVMQILRRELPYLRQQYGVVRLALYGSFAKGTAKARSDVDLLVELAQPLGFGFVTLADYLEAALGRKVHLATFGSLERSQQMPRYQPIAMDIQRTMIDVEPQTR